MKLNLNNDREFQTMIDAAWQRLGPIARLALLAQVMVYDGINLLRPLKKRYRAHWVS